MPDLTQVTSPSGVKFTVAKDAAEAFTGLLTDLEGRGYKIDQGQSGGYNPRNIAGTDTPSLHSFGHAIDINSQWNQRGAHTDSDLPSDIGDIAKQHGLTWGGGWSGDTRDPMHFEFHPGAKAVAATQPAVSWDSLGVKAPPDNAAPAATSGTPDQSPSPDQRPSVTWDSLGAKSAPDTVQPGTQPAASSSPPAPTNQSPLGVVGNSFLRGVHQGLDVPAEALAGGADWVARQAGYNTNQLQQTQQAAASLNQPYDANPANQGIVPTGARIAGNLLTTLPAALTAGGAIGNVARVGAEALPTVAGWAGPVVNTLTRYMPSVLSGAGAGATVSAQTGEPIGEGALLGGVLGGVMPAAKDAGNALLASRDPAVVQAVGEHGIPLRVGQVSGNKMARYLDDITATESSNIAQRTAVTTDAARSMGVTPELAAANGLPPGKVTPEVMSFARRLNGGVMNDVESKTIIQGAPAMDLATNLQTIAADAAKTPSAFADVKAHIKDVIDTISKNDGTLPGKAYGDLIAHGTPLDVATRADNSVVREYAGRIKEALQDAMQASAAPEDVARYAEARLRYKNMMTLAPLVNKGIPGDISPLLLQGAANRSFKDNAFRGAGQLGDLGDVAQQFLKSPSQSGTEPREFWRALLQGAPLEALRAAYGKGIGTAVQSVLGRNPLTPLGAVQPGAVSPLLPPVVQNRNQLQYQPPP
jgi:hypothetical protein